MSAVIVEKKKNKTRNNRIINPPLANRTDEQDKQNPEDYRLKTTVGPCWPLLLSPYNVDIMGSREGQTELPGKKSKATK